MLDPSGHHPRTAALEAFRALHDALSEGAHTFEHDAKVAQNLIDALAREPSITALASAFPISQERDRLSNVLERYETCRRNARLAMWRVMLAEGCSIGEVARIFGLSRQLVSRQLRDNQPRSDDAPASDPQSL